MSGEEGKMFVGGLSKLTTQASMQGHFGRFGEVSECSVMRDATTDQSRGFGFVTFIDPSSVDAVLAQPQHVLDGKQIDPKRCNPKQAAANRAAGGNMNRPMGGGMGGGMGGDRDGRLSKKVFVGGLPKDAKDTDVKEYFSMYGRVTEAVVVVNPENRQSRCFGFVSFDSPDAVANLTQMRFVDFKGKQVEIKCAEPREPSGNMGAPSQGPRGPAGRGRGMGDGGNGMAQWGMGAQAAGLTGPGAAMGQYPNYGPMAPAPWAAQQWAAMGWNPAYQQQSGQGYPSPGMYGMQVPGAANQGMTMPMPPGMNMAGMNVAAGMTGTMPMPVGPPNAGSEGNVQQPNYQGGPYMPNSNCPISENGNSGGYGQKSGEDYGRQDRTSYHPYKR